MMGSNNKKILFTMVDDPNQIYVFRKNNADRSPSLIETFQGFVDRGAIFQASDQYYPTVKLWVNGAFVTRWREVREE